MSHRAMVHIILGQSITENNSLILRKIKDEDVFCLIFHTPISQRVYTELKIEG